MSYRFCRQRLTRCLESFAAKRPITLPPIRTSLRYLPNYSASWGIHLLIIYRPLMLTIQRIMHPLWAFWSTWCSAKFSMKQAKFHFLFLIFSYFCYSVSAGEVSAVLSTKLAMKHAGIELEAMAAIAKAAKSRSLEDFKDSVFHSFLSLCRSLYSTLSCLQTRWRSMSSI